MSTFLRTNPRALSAARYATDPLSLARDFFAWDPQVARSGAAFVPAFEAKEAGDKFVIHADLPGVLDEDVEISVHQGALTISGHRKAEAEVEGETFSRRERQFGAFSRSFALPDTADVEQIEASLSAGVLTVVIAKRAVEQPRKIELVRKA